MAKKSFLEKLTGSVRIEDAPAEPETPAAELAAARKLTPRVEDDENDLLEEAAADEGQLTIDVYQTPNEIIIKSTIAGVSPEHLDISITNDMVTIRGKREKDEDVRGEDYYYQECYWGAFSRSIILPMDVDAEKASASLKNGILTIRLPKAEKTKTKKIKVKSEA